jgi:hypothetical protein
MKKVFSSVRVSVWALTGILAAGLLFAACNKSHNNDNMNTPVAGLMAFNLSPDVSLGGFTLSGNNLTPSPLAFNSFTGTYLGVYTGSRSVQSYNFNTGTTLATNTFNFEPSKFYSVFLVGTDSSFQNIIVNDSLDSLSSPSQAYIRYINAIPDASNPTVTIAVNGANVVNDNAAFTSVSQFTAVAPGAVTIHVTNGGSIESSRTITLEQGKVYTVLLSGKPGGTGDTAVQVKYITNGTVDQNTGKSSTASAKSVN